MTRHVKDLLERRNERTHQRYIFGSPLFAEGHHLGANDSDAREKFVAAQKATDPDSAGDSVLVKANAHQSRKLVRNTLSMDLMLSDTIWTRS